MHNLTKSNILIMFVIIICTLAIIGTNSIFSKQVALNINNQLLENEYKKIGGKENYLILQELQKKEIIGYLDKLKEEQPELIEKILNIQNSNYKILDKEIIKNLKDSSYLLGNTGATITLIEFSDLECPFCIEQNKKNISKKLLNLYPNDINYIYKNFPLPKHKNSIKEAEAGKCVEYLAGGNKYLEFLDEIYSTTKGGGEGFDLNNLVILAEKIGVNKEDFNLCYKGEQFSKSIENEFKEGISLGINSVPSNVIINNVTGEYIIISESKELIDYKKVIDELLNK